MNTTISTKLLRIALFSIMLFQIPALTSCNKVGPDGNGDNTEVNHELKGIWKVTNVRMGGAYMGDYTRLSYLIIDPESNYLAIFTSVGGKDTKCQFACEDFKIGDSGKELLVYDVEDLGENGSTEGKDPSYIFPYMLDGDDMFLYMDPSVLLSEEMLAKEPGLRNIIIWLSHDKELEAKVGTIQHPSTAETRSLWDWIETATGFVNEAFEIVADMFSENVITPHVSQINYTPWSNTGGWKYSNWMSGLSDDTLLCDVNIPGTHDSSASIRTMSIAGTSTGAACQTYTIPELFDKGARFYDMRIGTTTNDKITYLTEDLHLINQEAIDAMDDIGMYHGPLSTGVKYGEALEELAAKVYGSSEFMFVKTQWESNSYGLIEMAALWFSGSSFNEDLQEDIDKRDKWLKETIKTISMDVAHRIQKRIGSEYGDDLFINYSSDLTVGQARGHIILLEEPMDEERGYDNPQVTYMFSWADNKMKHGHICAYDQHFANIRHNDPHNMQIGDSYGYNMYLQNFYEMRLWEEGKILNKKDCIRDVAKKVTEMNMYEGKRILGYNALNVNAGGDAFYDLDTYEFAHLFNGYTFDLYVANMLRSNGDPRYRSGLVIMDQYGAPSYKSGGRFTSVDVYGDYLSWAVIESNFSL